MARILIATFGSFGDLFPYLAIGTELEARPSGYHCSAAHRPKVEAEGLDFHTTWPDIELENRELVAYAMDARRGSERVVRYIADNAVRESYEDTAAAARYSDAIVTHPITYGAVIAAQS